jgi:hypothetical protein
MKKKNLSLQLDHLPVFMYSGVLLVKEKNKNKKSTRQTDCKAAAFSIYARSGSIQFNVRIHLLGLEAVSAVSFHSSSSSPSLFKNASAQTTR